MTLQLISSRNLPDKLYDIHNRLLAIDADTTKIVYDRLTLNSHPVRLLIRKHLTNVDGLGQEDAFSTIDAVCIQKPQPEFFVSCSYMNLSEQLLNQGILLRGKKFVYPLRLRNEFNDVVAKARYSYVAKEAAALTIKRNNVSSRLLIRYHSIDDFTC